MPEEKLIRYFIGDKEVSWNEYVKTEGGPGKFAWKECDHETFYRVTEGAFYAVRYCSNCGKSWRMFVVAKYPSEFPPEWEPIKEDLEEERILPNYEE